MNRGCILAALFAASIAPSAQADDKRQWTGTAGTDSATLAYGIPQTDDTLISFTCDRTTRALTVVAILEPSGARDGMQAVVELSSEGGKVALKATGQYLVSDDSFMLEAATTLTPALQGVLRQGRTLQVRVNEISAALPLRGAVEQASGLFAACS